eukprot:350242-Chlamydomonas_euryale.AAC.9
MSSSPPPVLGPWPWPWPQDRGLWTCRDRLDVRALTAWRPVNARSISPAFCRTPVSQCSVGSCKKIVSKLKVNSLRSRGIRGVLGGGTRRNGCRAPLGFSPEHVVGSLSDRRNK